MPEFEQSRAVQASPEAVFKVVADVENLARFVPTADRAEATGDGRVRVEGEANGHHYEDEGWFRTDRGMHRLEWGSESTEGYSGWLRVAEHAEGAEVTLHLTVPGHGDDDAQHEEAARHGLEASLASIENLVEGHGGKVEPPEAGTSSEA